MLSIQYPISLPPEYDMKTIEARVRERAHAFENMPGLTIKAFLTTSIAEGDAQNMYAPFYVWEDSQSMLAFLTGNLFGAVIDSFGRPAVRSWQVLQCGSGDRSVDPKIATFESIANDAQRRPLDISRAEESAQRAAVELPGLLMSCALLDLDSWAVTRVRLWANEASVRGVGPGATRFRVLRALGSATGTRQSGR